MVCVMFIDEENIVRYCSEPMAWAKAEGRVVRIPGGEMTPADNCRIEIADAQDAIAAALPSTQYALVSEAIEGGMRTLPVEINNTLEG